jgi:hypothetical protein
MFEVTKEFNGHKVGDKVNFKSYIANDLIKEGYIKAEKVVTKERKLTK